MTPEQRKGHAQYGVGYEVTNPYGRYSLPTLVSILLATGYLQQLPFCGWMHLANQKQPRCQVESSPNGCGLLEAETRPPRASKQEQARAATKQDQDPRPFRS